MSAARRVLRAMGTIAEVLVTDRAGDPTAERHLDHAAARIAELERRWSRFLPDSELSQLNRAGGAPMLVSDDTFLLVQLAATAWQLTSGRFDPTVHDALVAHGYDRDLVARRRLAPGTIAASLDVDRATGRGAAPGPGAPADPGLDPVAAADPARGSTPSLGSGPAPGLDGVVLDGAIRAITLPPGVRIDPGGIGKGLAADIVVGELLAAGAAGALVSLGGDLRVGGRPPEGDRWVVAVDDPADRRRILATLALVDGAVVTSSLLGRGWLDADGCVAHHVIDPATGAPVVADDVTATVVAGEAWWAEAVATALLVPPGADGAAGFDGTAAIVVDRSGRVRTVGDLDPYLAGPGADGTTPVPAGRDAGDAPRSVTAPAPSDPSPADRRDPAPWRTRP